MLIKKKIIKKMELKKIFLKDPLKNLESELIKVLNKHEQ